MASPTSLWTERGPRKPRRGAGATVTSAPGTHAVAAGPQSASDLPGLEREFLSALDPSLVPPTSDASAGDALSALLEKSGGDGDAGHPAVDAAAPAQPVIDDTDFDLFRARPANASASAKVVTVFGDADAAAASSGTSSDSDVGELDDEDDADVFNIPRDEQLVPARCDWDSYKYDTMYMKRLRTAVANKDLDAVLALFYGRRAMPGFEDRLYGPESDSDDDVALSQKEQQARLARIAADETGGKGVNFVEYNVVLDACARAGDLAAAREVLATLHHERGEFTVDHVTLMIKAAAVAGDYAAAESAWRVLITMNFQPTVHTYAGMIAATVHAGKVKQAYELFNRCVAVALWTVTAAVAMGALCAAVWVLCLVRGHTGVWV